jgi:hypothetical protein
MKCLRNRREAYRNVVDVLSLAKPPPAPSPPTGCCGREKLYVGSAPLDGPRGGVDAENRAVAGAGRVSGAARARALTIGRKSCCTCLQLAARSVLAGSKASVKTVPRKPSICSGPKKPLKHSRLLEQEWFRLYEGRFCRESTGQSRRTLSHSGSPSKSSGEYGDSCESAELVGRRAQGLAMH